MLNLFQENIEYFAGWRNHFELAVTVLTIVLRIACRVGLAARDRSKVVKWTKLEIVPINI